MAIKLFTWNIFTPSEDRLERTMFEILNLEPDIITLNEIQKGTGTRNIDNIKARFKPKGYCYFDNGVVQGNAVMIISKVPFKRNKSIFVPELLKQHVAVLDFNQFVMIGLFDNCFKDKGNELINFLNRVKDLSIGQEIIATGDFDCGCNSENEYKGNLTKLEEKGWKNVWNRDNEKEQLSCFSFQRFNKDNVITGRSRPDHIFATEEIAKKITSPKFLLDFLEIRIPNAKGKLICLSDHAPLLANLEI